MTQATQSRPQRLIIAITGATGVLYGYRILQELHKNPLWETHLILSAAALITADQEAGLRKSDFEALADVVHNVKDISASIASGSFLIDGMVVAPCSMKTLAAIAAGLSDNLITRAADVCLKQRRRLVLITRETPLNRIHLRNMTEVTDAGGIIFPPMAAFYAGIQSLEQMVDHSVGQVFDLFDIEHIDLMQRWEGL